MIDLTQVFLWATVFLDPIAAAIFVLFMLPREDRLNNHFLYRAGLVILAIGLLGQAVRSYIGITTGVAPRDDEMPWWVGKDLGVVLIALAYIADVRKSKG